MAYGKIPKLRRSGIEAEDAAPTGLLAGRGPFATNRSLLWSCRLALPFGESPTGMGGSPVLPIIRTQSEGTSVSAWTRTRQCSEAARAARLRLKVPPASLLVAAE